MQQYKRGGALRAGHHGVAEQAQQQHGQLRDHAQRVLLADPVALKVEGLERGAVAQRRERRRRRHAVVRHVEGAQLGEGGERREVGDGVVREVECAQRGQRGGAGEAGDDVLGGVQAAQLRHVVEVLEGADSVALEVDHLEAGECLRERQQWLQAHSGV